MARQMQDGQCRTTGPFGKGGERESAVAVDFARLPRFCRRRGDADEQRAALWSAGPGVERSAGAERSVLLHCFPTVGNGKNFAQAGVRGRYGHALTGSWSRHGSAGGMGSVVARRMGSRSFYLAGRWRMREARLRSTSSSVVAQEETLMRRARRPDQRVEPSQHSPSA